jgi:hypothetical protein
VPNTLANLARVASSTTGTGALTLGSAATGCLTFADAGVANGAVVTYAIEDYDGSGNIIAREIGAGTYSTTGPTLSRDTVYASTNAGSKINCSGLQHVFVTASKEDFSSLLTSAAAAAAYQPLDADLTAIAALTSAANKVPYSTGASAWALADFSAAGRALVDDADATAQRATLGLVIGTNVQAYDGELAAIAGLTSAADRLPYFTGSGTAALATFTTAGRNLVDDADASAQRTTLGVGTGDSPTFTALTLSNGQIAFPATAVASANVNTLDDYEEGTFTPAYTFATVGDLTFASTVRDGRYTKIGNRVFISGYCQTDTFTWTTASSYIQITGLPFTSISNFNGGGSIVMSGYTKAGYNNLFMETSNSTFMYVLAGGSGVGLAELTAADFTTGGVVRSYFSGHYRAT